MSQMIAEVLAVLWARDNLYPPDLKTLIQAEFLRGAAVAFSACWRGDESAQCLAKADEIDVPAK